MPSARLIIAAAVVAAGAAFGIGFVVGTPAAAPAGAGPLETVTAPDPRAIPALRGDLAPLPDLASPPRSTPTDRGSGGGSRPSGPSVPVEEPTDEGGIIS